MSTTDLILSMVATLAALAVVVWLIVKYSTAEESLRPSTWRYYASGLFGFASIAVVCLSTRVAGVYLDHAMVGDAAMNVLSGLLLAIVLGSLAWLLVADDEYLESDLPPDSRVSEEPRGPWGDDGSSKP